jgi:hypothetical protein
VIQRQGDGFPLDQNRLAYLRYLRRERQQSPRTEADAEHAKAKAALLRLRIAEKQRELVPRADFDAVIDGIAGGVLTHLSGMAARCSNDLRVRRKIGAVVYEVRKEMAKVALEMADKNGEPPLSELGSRKHRETRCEVRFRDRSYWTPRRAKLYPVPVPSRHLLNLTQALLQAIKLRTNLRNQCVL